MLASEFIVIPRDIREKRTLYDNYWLSLGWFVMFQQDVIHWMLYEVKYLPAALRPGWRLPAESAPNICRIETQRWRYSSALQTEMNLMTQKVFIYSYSNIFILIVIRGLRCTIINNKSVNVFINLQKERCLDSMSRQTFSTHISPQGAVDSAESDWFLSHVLCRGLCVYFYPAVILLAWIRGIVNHITKT